MSQRLGEPPEKFTTPPVLESLPVGTRVFRIYFRGGAHPTTWDQFRDFGPTGSRFDHHTRPKRRQQRAIMYVTMGSHAILSALAEVFQLTRHIDRSLGDPWLAAFDLAGPAPLLNTNSPWTAQAGGNMAINSGLRSRSRDWSRCIYRSYPKVVGVAYPSSLTNRPCAALYERASGSVPSHPQLNMPLSQPALGANLLAAATQLNYTIS